MPVFSLRLPENLEADARAKAAWFEFQSMRLFVSQLIRICTEPHCSLLQSLRKPYPYPLPLHVCP